MIMHAVKSCFVEIGRLLLSMSLLLVLQAQNVSDRPNWRLVKSGQVSLDCLKYLSNFLSTKPRDVCLCILGPFVDLLLQGVDLHHQYVWALSFLMLCELQEVSVFGIIGADEAYICLRAFQLGLGCIDVLTEFDSPFAMLPTQSTN